MDRLLEQGLNLHAHCTLDALPDDLRLVLQHNLEVRGVEHAPDWTVWLIGHGGTLFWETSQPLATVQNPLDARTYALVADALQGYEHHILYPPSDAPVPLMALAEHMQFGQQSTMGLLIRPDYGLWVACRALVVMPNGPVLPTSQTATESPCTTCVDQPCRSACRGQAIRPEGGQVWSQCGDYRLLPDSACAQQCVARKACPISRDHAYSQEQIAYHYGVSLQSLQRYRYNQ